MKTYKPQHLNTYVTKIKFFLLIIFSFFVVCCVRQETKQVTPQNGGKLSAEMALDINSASSAELEKLPFVGAVTAQKIVEHREKYGKFRRVEHLLLIQGISDKKFRQIKNMIKAD